MVMAGKKLLVLMNNEMMEHELLVGNDVLLMYSQDCNCIGNFYELPRAHGLEFGLKIVSNFE